MCEERLVERAFKLGLLSLAEAAEMVEYYKTATRRRDPGWAIKRPFTSFATGQPRFHWPNKKAIILPLVD